ncbi:SIR2 family protein [Comamonas antarctica]|uniref:SIR2 family NAD-dependent protein deacylase n=1 Tax=Comamonas antarctica TaxID=2743470 RepID=UPI0028F06778|nr:SIR2 family protein [Comamonas antarctica]
MSADSTSPQTSPETSKIPQIANPMSSSKEYPDAVHLRSIRNALANGNAAVMVGSGFSRNAEGGHNVGTWADLAKAFAAGMSEGKNDGKSEGSFGASQAIQLAEQYERLFSRPALEQILKQIVPDERLAPGHLHSALLSLQWTEVLTTNYDTLLERTAEALVDSSYFTICCREDIPQSKMLGRRRIVKLHGSFSSHRPFIVTEEDYRKYPEDFAPFVNLVRQSLLENVMCLIGFSGDDPNFLHWIGWVRDMQDKHALPIYLMLSRPPSLGQRMLLQARGVTPVVLPPSDDNEESNYEGRYKKLFELLAEPIEGNSKQWGEVSWPENQRQYHDSPKKQYKSFLTSLPTLAQHRHNYPGWLIAPQLVRLRLDRSMNVNGSWFDDTNIIDSLENEDPAFVLAALNLYAWIQSTILKDMSDNVVQLALRTLRDTASIHFSQLKPDTTKLLEKFRINNQNALTDTWTYLGLEVMNWARRGHWLDAYNQIQKLLIEWRKTDAQVLDHITYQEILLLLHNGERLAASQKLHRWQIKGSDAYMEIRRAVLVAELGNVRGALENCERVVQLLRRQQRSRPDDPRLLSEESWACLIAMQLRKHIEQLSLYGMLDEEELTFERIDQTTTLRQDTTTPPAVPKIRSTDKRDTESVKHKTQAEEFNLRLKTIGNKGYSSAEELRNIRENLGKEAGTVRSEKINRFNSFSLGVTSNTRIFGQTSEISNKFNAAFAWLQLAEKVGLVPQAGGFDFYSAEFMQAAWWFQYLEAEPFHRGFGILYRCMREDYLKPKDKSLPQYKSGWLTRMQVASLPAIYAENHAENFLVYLEYHLSTVQRIRDSRRNVHFFSEVFGRLVLRVEDQKKLLDWGKRLVAAHTLRGTQNESSCWDLLGKALAQCMEALTPQNQRTILLQAYQLHNIKSDSRDFRSKSDWLNIYNIYAEMDPLQADDNIIRSEWEPITTELIQRITEKHENYEDQGLWLRLFVADALQLLDEKQRRVVGHFLWQKYDENKWPLMKGFNLNATLRWPAPHSINIESAYKRSLLSRTFSPFSEKGSIQLNSKSKRSWHLPGDQSLGNAFLISLKQYSWSTDELNKLISMLEDWVNSDASDLIQDIPSFEELMPAVMLTLQNIDNILSTILINKILDKSKEDKILLRRRIWSLYAKFSPFPIKLWRMSFLETDKKGMELQLIAIQGEFQFDMTSRDDKTLIHAYRSASWLLQNATRNNISKVDFIFESLVSVITGRIMPALVRALEVLSTQTEEVWRKHLNKSRLFRLDTALGKLREDLEIMAHRPRNTGFPDDVVPVLRFKCAQLAYALHRHSGYACPNALQWLANSKVDPLPELRLSRFKANVDHTNLNR